MAEHMASQDYSEPSIISFNSICKYIQISQLKTFIYVTQDYLSI